jgi:hypothetical protein
MKTKLSLLVVALLSVALLGACKKEQAAAEQKGQDAGEAISKSIEAAQDAATAIEAAAVETTEAVSAAAEEAKEEAVDAIQAAKDAAAAEAAK